MIDWNNKAEVLSTVAVKQDERALQCASERLRNDEELKQSALKQQPN